MLDPNLLAALIGIIFAILTHKIMIEKYKQLYLYYKSKTSKKKVRFNLLLDDI